MKTVWSWHKHADNKIESRAHTLTGGQLVISKNAKTVQWGKEQSSQQMILEQLDVHMPQNEVRLLMFTIYTDYRLDQMGHRPKCKS